MFYRDHFNKNLLSNILKIFMVTEGVEVYELFYMFL